MTIQEILPLLGTTKKTTNGWESRCPAHQDQRASLSIAEGSDGKVLLKCFAGCTPEVIVSALGLKMADLFPEKAKVAIAPRRIVKHYDYTNESGESLYQCVRYEPKDFRQRKPNPQKRGAWIWSLEGVRRVLYRLPGVLGAVKDGRTVFVVEGEKDADRLIDAGFVATCNPMGAGKWQSEYTEMLRGAKRVVVVADKDNAGRAHARTVADSLLGIVEVVKLIELPDRNGKPIKDAADWFDAGGTSTELKEIVNKSPDHAPIKLADIEKPSARAGEYLPSPLESQQQSPAKAVLPPQVELWPSPINGAELLDELATIYRTFLVLPPHADTILAVWTVHTYCWDRSEYSPIVAVTSPTKECGKSRVLDLAKQLVNRPFRTGNLSEAVLFRMIQSRKPTTLVDEFDSIPEERRSAIANVLKQGFQKSGVVHRVEGESSREVKEFSCYGPKAIACIKLSTLDGPTVSRCINIRMQRKRPDQKVQRLRKYDGTDLQRKCLRWVTDHSSRFELEVVVMPESLGDREQDIWEPLFVIAQLASGEWLDRVTRAALALNERTGEDREDVGVTLLGWIRQYFVERRCDRVSSADLTVWLNGQAEAPFGLWNEGQGIKQHGLAKHLAMFDVIVTSVRFQDGTRKGILRKWLDEAFSAYLPENPASKWNTGTEPVNIDDSRGFQSGTEESCSASEKCLSTNEINGCSTVPLFQGGDRGLGHDSPVLTGSFQKEMEL